LKEGDAGSEGVGFEVEPVLVVEIALRVVDSWKIAFAKPLDPSVERMGSLVNGLSKDTRRVLGWSVLSVTRE
jgi:hypothetical protein